MADKNALYTAMAGMLLSILLSIGTAQAAEDTCGPVRLPEQARCSSAAMLDALNDELLITGPSEPDDLYAEGWMFFG